MNLNVPAMLIGFALGVAACAIALLIAAVRIGKKARNAGNE